jgi:alkylhydroperoxidase/carboxymuconolactone decarboxylase family protein YurZ
MPTVQDVTKLLTEAQIRQFRGGYDEDWMNRTAEAALILPYPPATPLADTVTKLFYSPGAPLSAAEREMCLIGTLAHGPSPLFLAVHLYWGLAVGLDPDKMADVLLLMGTYAGLPIYSSAIATMETTFAALQMLAAGYPVTEPIPSPAAIGALRQVFSPPATAALGMRFPEGLKAAQGSQT